MTFSGSKWLVVAFLSFFRVARSGSTDSGFQWLGVAGQWLLENVMWLQVAGVARRWFFENVMSFSDTAMGAKVHFLRPP